MRGKVHPVHRVYVQCWTLVELPARAQPYTDAEIVAYARAHYATDETCEIDANAKVSRGHDACDCVEEDDA
jgi:hypothetical protein